MTLALLMTLPFSVAPDGSRVNGTAVPGFTRNKGSVVVRLRKTGIGTPVEGIYKCFIADKTTFVCTAQQRFPFLLVPETLIQLIQDIFIAQEISNWWSNCRDPPCYTLPSLSSLQCCIVCEDT